MPIYGSERAYHIFSTIFFVLLGAMMLSPMIHVLAISLSASNFVDAGEVYLWPKGWNVAVYEQIVKQKALWKALGVSLTISVVGVIIHLLFTSTMAYAVSRPHMPFRKFIMKAVVITFIFGAPLIPYFLVVDYLQLTNTLWALMLPGAIGAFGVIIMKTFFQGISAEIFDAAAIDGCSEFSIYARMCVPLSLPVFATIGLFHAVGSWNSYFNALIFIRDKNLYPLQLILRGLIVREDSPEFAAMNQLHITPETMKAGIIIFATIPIILVYPFLQKYFVKGAHLGSLKE